MALGYKKQFGHRGEDAACEYLRKKGYKIIERNFRLRNAEIDIIAIDRSEKDPVLAFVEVKSRTSDRFGEPFEAIGYYKLQAMNRAAMHYQMIHSHLPKLLRLDAISITADGVGTISSIKLMKNIG